MKELYEVVPGVEEEIQGGFALDNGQAVGEICDSAAAGAGLDDRGVFVGMVFYVPCGVGASGRLDCLLFAPQRRLRLHSWLLLPLSG